MRGLLRNNFYSANENLKMAFIINIILMLISTVFVAGDLIYMMIPLMPYMFIANLGTALHTDTVSKWNRFELTMPIQRSDVIKARYISFLIISLCGILMSVATIVVAYGLGLSLNPERIGFGLTFGIILALITASILYPALLKFGTEKNEMIIVISALISAGLFVLVSVVLVPLLPENSDANLIFRSGIIVLSVLVFVASYFLSQSMYCKKEL